MAAVKGLQSSNPLITRIGSSARRLCVSSSPKMRPISVAAPTIVMYNRVMGRIFLYLLMVSEMGDFFAFSAAAAPTFFLPVTVLDDDDDELLSDPVRFLERCFDAPPRRSNSSCGGGGTDSRSGFFLFLLSNDSRDGVRCIVRAALQVVVDGSAANSRTTTAHTDVRYDGLVLLLISLHVEL